MSAGGVQPSNPDPLRETTRYVKVADLSHGSFGFVQLARNTETQELVAIKFIERGDRVNRYVPPAVIARHNMAHEQQAAVGVFRRSQAGFWT
jgi:serine/threonine-protein kinase SRK2